MRILTCGVLLLGMAASGAAAQETITYSYDVHGRLVEAARSTGAETDYAYDAGDSRTSRVTTGGSSLMAEAESAAAQGPGAAAALADEPEQDSEEGEDSEAGEAAPES